MLCSMALVFPSMSLANHHHCSDHNQQVTCIGSHTWWTLPWPSAWQNWTYYQQCMNLSLSLYIYIYTCIIYVYTYVYFSLSLYIYIYIYIIRLVWLWSLVTPGSTRRPGQLWYSIWEFDYNFTNHNFRKTLECSEQPLPEGWNSRVVLTIQGFFEITVGEIIRKSSCRYSTRWIHTYPHW